MASSIWKSHLLCVRNFNVLHQRAMMTSTTMSKNIRTGRPKRTINRSKPLTYEESQPPYRIGVTKSWNSWNTSNLFGEGRESETTVEDMFMRKFMAGTWSGLLVSEVIIKRRFNLIIIAGLASRSLSTQKMYFLIGYSEELLSHVMKCPVRLELQTVANKKDMIFKYI